MLRCYQQEERDESWFERDPSHHAQRQSWRCRRRQRRRSPPRSRRRRRRPRRKPAPAKPATTTPATQKPATAKPATAKPATAKPAAPSALLRTPSKLKDVAPATFRANFETSVGVFVVEVTRAWAPKGADRFYNLVKYGYFDGDRFFRVVPNFMVQFGINGDPKLNGVWQRGQHPRRPGDAEQQARVRSPSRRAGTQLAHDPGLHQLQGQRRPRRAGVRALRSGREPVMDVVDKINARVRRVARVRD